MKFRAILNDENDKEIPDDEKISFKPWMKTGLFFLVWSAILISLAVIYTAKSKCIYFGGDADYWKIARNIASGELTRDGFWKSVYTSIGTREYNYLAGLLPAAFAFLFGNTRVVYIAGLVIAYLIPSVILMHMLAKKLGKSPEFSVSVILLMCPVIAGLVFYGFADTGGLPICLLCYLLYFTDESQKQSVIKSAVTGALLAVLVVWRSYYAFFAVSFATAMIADVILFRKKWYCAVISILTAAAILFFGFRDFVMNFLISGFGNFYSAYEFAPSLDLKLAARYFGILLILFLAGCSVYLCVKKKEYKPIILWIQIISCAAMFVATQTHGQQHFLLYLPSVIVLLILIIKNIDNTWIKTGICVLAVINTVNVEIPREQPQSIREIPHYALIPDFPVLPQTSPDAVEILSLKRRLDAAAEQGKTMIVLSDSSKLNADMLLNAEPSFNLKETRGGYIHETPQSDADISALFEADYILAAYPAQTSYAGGNQKLITAAVDSFYNYTDLARAFAEMPECETAIDGITIKLFRKTREITEFEQAQFKNKL